jgi:cyclase
VLRFKNEELNQNLNIILKKIQQALLDSHATPPSRDWGVVGLSKRIIPCLDVKDGRTVKGVNFVDLRDAGDPVELAAQYAQQGADELVFLDITATHERRKTMIEMVKSVARQLNIPFTIGGGISEIADAEALLNAGADKISINSAAVKNPQLIEELAKAFGVQFVVLAVDTKQINGKNIVHLNGGRLITELETESWIKKAENLGAGEILLTSMDHDGTKQGFDCELLGKINQQINIPIIASGGAGKTTDFTEVFQKAGVDAALAASVFHYGEILIPDLKQELRRNGIQVRI